MVVIVTHVRHNDVRRVGGRLEGEGPKGGSVYQIKQDTRCNLACIIYTSLYTITATIYSRESLCGSGKNSL